MLAVVAIAHFKQFVKLFHQLVDWVQIKPLEAAIVIILVYIIMVSLTLPISYISIPLGYAFRRAFDSAASNLFFYYLN